MSFTLIKCQKHQKQVLMDSSQFTCLSAGVSCWRLPPTLGRQKSWTLKPALQGGVPASDRACAPGIGGCACAVLRLLSRGDLQRATPDSQGIMGQWASTPFGLNLGIGLFRGSGCQTVPSTGNGWYEALGAVAIWVRHNCPLPGEKRG